jgi:hypothetical protein
MFIANGTSESPERWKRLANDATQCQDMKIIWRGSQSLATREVNLFNECKRAHSVTRL